ncbi:hypothetical protein [uncultured Desulfosarcina sp.]|uniref:hypothetical protein n=1 Tax=uncultured Desulfosarcina sp. TaxID=218289 RepID=UPI0029C8E4A4|nr:hypothetical protein [uncultured Desulfosarcina sp.]
MKYIDIIIQDIENTENNHISKEELGCISRLIHNSGIREDEIPVLRVQHVIDANGDVKSAITTKKIIRDNGEIQLTDESRDAIAAYQKAMREKDPSLVMKRQPLFPSYKTERTIRRHLKAVGTKYSEIREMGIKNHFARNAFSDGPITPIYKAGGKIFRIAPREYYAVGADKKIPYGVEVHDDKQIIRLLDLWGQAQRLDSNDPNANSQANEILQQAYTAFNRIEIKKNRENNKILLETIYVELSPFQFKFSKI